MKRAKRIDDIVVLAAGECEGEFYLVTGCADYDNFRQLPGAVAFEGRRYGRTGWNSDSNQAYYKANAALAVALN